MIRLDGIIWKTQFAEKLEQKHQVSTREVEEVLFSNPIIRRLEKGLVDDEHLYIAYGQTRAGRYIIVVFVLKRLTAALPISARDMTSAERNYYEQQR